MNTARRVRALANSFGKTLHIVYVTGRKNRTERLITPLCFVESAKTGGPMVLAYCWKRAALRRFHITNMLSIDPAPTTPVPIERLMELLFESERDLKTYRERYVLTSYALERWADG